MANRMWRDYGNRMLEESRRAEFGSEKKAGLSPMEYIAQEAKKADYHTDETDIRNYANTAAPAVQSESGLVGTKKTITGGTAKVYKKGSGYEVRYSDGSKDWAKSLDKIKGFVPAN
jgi:hypothetical protein